MSGFIRERDLQQAELVFPGIVRLFESLSPKPSTFLELVALYDRADQSRPASLVPPSEAVPSRASWLCRRAS